jgi:hypothetical protein
VGMNTNAIIGISVAVYAVWFAAWWCVFSDKRFETSNINSVRVRIFFVIGGPISWIVFMFFLMWRILRWVLFRGKQ